jgi:hypothetical protein
MCAAFGAGAENACPARVVAGGFGGFLVQLDEVAGVSNQNTLGVAGEDVVVVPWKTII